MAEDRDKQDEVGTELDLPENDSSGTARPSSNMSFGMLDLGGDSAEELDIPPPEVVQKPPKAAPEPKAQPPPKPPAEHNSKSEPAPPDKQPASGGKAEPYTIRSQRTSPSGLPMARSSRIREESSLTEQPSSGSSSRTIKIAIIVLLILGMIGGGVYLLLRWQENAEKERQAELDRLNQQSRDSLMDDRFKNQ